MDRQRPPKGGPADGWERRSPTGIARERETSANDAALCQGEGRHAARRAVKPRTADPRGRLERRSPTGIARERETSANDAGPYSNREDQLWQIDHLILERLGEA